MDRIVLAYAGGLETSAGISWLAGKYRAEVVTLTLDVGEGKALDDMRERALADRARFARTSSTFVKSSRATSCCRRFKPAPWAKAAIC